MVSMRCCLGVASAMLLVAGCTFPEEKPKAKTPQVVCPPEPPLKGMALATIHEFHLAQAGYPFSRLGDALDAYRPDLILVDMAQDHLKGAHPEDASIEIEYVKYIASTRSTEIIAIGPDREDAPIQPHLERGDEDALGRDPVATNDPLALNMTFDQSNGAEGTHKIMTALNARARYLKGDPDWARREAWLEHEVDKVMTDKQPKRVLVLVDPVNRPAMEAHLFERGLKMLNPVTVVTESKEKRDENAVPSVVLSTWQEHLVKLQDRLHRLRPGVDRSWLEYKVNLYQLAIDRHGTCCISLDMFSLPASNKKK